MTVVELAKLAGVSIGTIDRVLHNRKGVSIETKARVLDLIERTGYKPNSLARQLKLNKQYNIIAMIPSLVTESGYWKLVLEGINKATSELKELLFNIKLIEFDRGNKKKYKGILKYASSLKPDGIILAPVFQAATENFINSINSDIPCVFIDTLISHFENSKYSYIVQNAYKSGQVAAKLMSILMKDINRPIFVINPYREAYNLSEREKGFKEYFSHKYHKIVNTVNVNDDICNISLDDIIQKNYKKYTCLGGIFCVNSSVHLVGETLHRMKLKKNCIVIGYDLVEANISGLKNDLIDCIISQSPDQQAYLACYNLYQRLVLGIKNTAHRNMPIDIIFKENVDESRNLNI